MRQAEATEIGVQFPFGVENVPRVETGPSPAAKQLAYIPVLLTRRFSAHGVQNGRR